MNSAEWLVCCSAAIPSRKMRSIGLVRYRAAEPTISYNSTKVCRLT